jgi:hypothetical protein
MAATLDGGSAALLAALHDSGKSALLVAPLDGGGITALLGALHDDAVAALYGSDDTIGLMIFCFFFVKLKKKRHVPTSLTHPDCPLTHPS